MNDSEASVPTIERPGVATIAGTLLGLAAVAVLLEWVLMSDVVVSNGAQFFFIMLWGYLAFATFRGHGWVRGAIVAVLIVTVWGFANATSASAALAATSAGSLAAKTFALGSLVLMLLPAATTWFRGTRLAIDANDVARAAGSIVNKAFRDD